MPAEPEPIKVTINASACTRKPESKIVVVNGQICVIEYESIVTQNPTFTIGVLSK